MNLVFPNTTEFCTRIMCIWNVFVCSGVYIHYKNFPPNISCQIRCPHIDIVLFSSIFIIIFKIHTNYPFCPYPFRCLYIGIQNSAQMSSVRSGVYNITGKNKVGTRIVYNIFWLDEPVQVSINSNTEFCPNVLCPFRCLYIDIGGLGQLKTRVSAYFYFLKKFAFVRSGVYI